MIHVAHDRRQTRTAPGTAPDEDDAQRMDWEGASANLTEGNEMERTEIVPVTHGSGEYRGGEHGIESGQRTALGWDDVRSALPFLIAAAAVGVAAVAMLRSERGQRMSETLIDTTSEWADRLYRLSHGLQGLLRNLEERGVTGFGPRR